MGGCDCGGRLQFGWQGVAMLLVVGCGFGTSCGGGVYH